MYTLYMTQMHTKDSIHQMLLTNSFAVERALLALYARQTDDEQSAEITKEKNGRGFASADAEFYSRLATQVASSPYPKGQRLSPKQLDALRGIRNGVKTKKRGITKYAGQLLLVARERTRIS